MIRKTIGTLSLFSDANQHQCLRLNKSGDDYIELSLIFQF